MPGARCTRSRAWCVVNTRVSHHRSTGTSRHSRTQWFYGLFRALPGDRALLPPSSAELLPPTRHQRRGVRTTRLRRPLSCRSSKALSASTASHPASVTIAIRPSVGWDGDRYRSDLGQTRKDLFLQTGLDSKFTDLPVGQISRPVRRNYSISLAPTRAGENQSCLDKVCSAPAPTR